MYPPFTPPAQRPAPPLPRPPLPHSPTYSAESFDDQVAWFLDRYSGGFQAPLWEGDMRGMGAKSRLKRHRDAAVEHAQKLLSEDRLRFQLTLGNTEQIVTDLTTVLSKTTLVPIGQVRQLDRLDVQQRAALAKALVEHLYPRESEGSFAALIKALSPALSNLRGSWAFVTALRALVFPKEHACVQPGKFALQARIMHRELPNASKPSERDYLAYRTLAREVERELRQRGLPRATCSTCWTSCGPRSRRAPARPSPAPPRGGACASAAA